jgi:hypothetical protein
MKLRSTFKSKLNTTLRDKEGKMPIDYATDSKVLDVMNEDITEDEADIEKNKINK